VPEMPRRSLLSSLRHRGHPMPEWHAVAETIPEPTKTVCGTPYFTEAHRTWDQTASGARCPRCERLVEIALKARGATFIADGTKAPPERPRPRQPRVPKGA
jgi:hypothetical protein